MGGILCVITKNVISRTGRLCSRYMDMPEAHNYRPSVFNPALNKPRLLISSLNIIIKLKLCWQRPKY